MSNLSLLMLAAAVACFVAHSTGHTHCTRNQDCFTVCLDQAHAVCDPSGHCHCHVEGEITCNDDLTCRQQCPPPNGNACCHNDHHCHCSEPCGRTPK